MKLFHYVVDVILDRVERQGQPLGDLLVAQPLSDQVHDLHFAWCHLEGLDAILPPRAAGGLAEPLEHRVDQLRRAESLSPHHRLDRALQAGQGGFLQHAAVDSRPEALIQALLAVAARQQKHLRRGEVLANVPRELDGLLPGQVQADQKDVRRLRFDQFQVASSGMVHLADLELRDIGKHRNQALPKQAIGMRHADMDGSSHGGSSSLATSLTDTPRPAVQRSLHGGTPP